MNAGRVVAVKTYQPPTIAVAGLSGAAGDEPPRTVRRGPAQPLRQAGLDALSPGRRPPRRKPRRQVANGKAGPSRGPADPQQV